MAMTRVRYLLFNLSNEQLDLIAEGLEILRLYQQGFVDVDGRGKLTAIKHLESRIQRRRKRAEERMGHEKQDTNSRSTVSKR